MLSHKGIFLLAVTLFSDAAAAALQTVLRDDGVWSIKIIAIDSEVPTFKFDFIAKGGSRYLAMGHAGLSGGNAMDGGLVVVYKPPSTFGMYMLNFPAGGSPSYELLSDLTANSTLTASEYGIIDIHGEFDGDVTTLTIVTSEFALQEITANQTQTDSLIFARGFVGAGFSRHQNQFKAVLNLPSTQSQTNNPTPSPMQSPSRRPTFTPVTGPVTVSLGAGWSLTSGKDVSTGTNNEVVYKFTVVITGDYWVALGMAGDNFNAMAGGSAVIFRPFENSVKLYYMGSTQYSSIQEQVGMDGIISASANRTGKVTTLTVVATSFGDAPIASETDATRSRKMIFALGEPSYFDYHFANRVLQSVSLGDEPPTTQSPTSASFPKLQPTLSPIASDGAVTTALSDGWSLTSGKVSPVNGGSESAQLYKFTMVLSDDAWVGIGMGGQDDQAMVGGSVLIYRPDLDTSELYSITGKDISDVKEMAGLEGIESIEKTQMNGVTTLTVVASAFGNAAIVSETDSGLSRRMIFARGDAGNGWGYHSKRVTLAGVSLGGAIANLPNVMLSSRLVAHIVLMVISWGVLIPVGVVAAIVKRTGYCVSDGRWFTIHRFANGFGVLLGSIGSILGFMLVSDNATPFDATTHFGVGIAVFVLGIAQVIAGVSRPHVPGIGEDKTNIRKRFEVGHRAGGILSFSLAQLNLVLGTSYLASISQDGTDVFSGLSVGSFETVVFVLVGVALVSMLGAGYVGYLRKNCDDTSSVVSTDHQASVLSSANRKFEEIGENADVDTKSTVVPF